MSYIPKFQGLRRRALLSLVVVAMLMALLPTAAFAGSPNNGRPHRPYNQQYNQRYNNDRNNNDRNNNWNHDNKGGNWDRDGGKHYNYCADTYKVRKGDTLSEIARHYRVSVRELSKTNGIKNPNRIYAGQHLCIPH